MDFCMFPPRILAQLPLVKSIEKLLEKTWHSSSESLVKTSSWTFNSHECEWSNSAWSFTSAAPSEITIASLWRYHSSFCSPQFVTVGISVFYLRYDFRILTLGQLCCNKQRLCLVRSVRHYYVYLLPNFPNSLCFSWSCVQSFTFQFGSASLYLLFVNSSPLRLLKRHSRVLYAVVGSFSFYFIRYFVRKMSVASPQTMLSTNPP
jgi:hypothetical protein